MKSIQVDDFEISNDKPFTLIAGPCVIENEKMMHINGNGDKVQIKKYTNRPIKIRKKMPKKARGSRGFCDSLENIYCVVSLHTMAMTEALREGCPVISLVPGCLKDYSVNSIDKINNLYYPENRQYLFNCLTNLQFNSDELISGFAWNTISKYYGINISKQA